MASTSSPNPDSLASLFASSQTFCNSADAFGSPPFLSTIADAHRSAAMCRTWTTNAGRSSSALPGKNLAWRAFQIASNSRHSSPFFDSSSESRGRTT